MGETANSACGPHGLISLRAPHQFDIKSDEPIKSVKVNLANMRGSEARFVSPHHVVAKVHVADSSGEIKVLLTSGAEVSCPVGYITTGEPEPHNLSKQSRRCNGA